MYFPALLRALIASLLAVTAADASQPFEGEFYVAERDKACVREGADRNVVTVSADSIVAKTMNVKFTALPEADRDGTWRLDISLTPPGMTTAAQLKGKLEISRDRVQMKLLAWSQSSNQTIQATLVRCAPASAVTQAAGTSSRINVPPCAVLADFRLQQSFGGRLSTSEREAIQWTFGLKPEAWSDVDITAFKDGFFRCRRADDRFKGNVDREWFLGDDGPVAVTAQMIASSRAEAAIGAEAKAKFDQLIIEVRKLGTQPLSEQAKAELKRIAKTASSLELEYARRGWNGNEGISVANAINDVERADLARRQNDAQGSRAAVASEQAAEQEAREKLGRISTHMSMFRMSAVCAENGIVFTQDEVEKMKTEMVRSLDAANVSGTDRDNAWEIAGVGVKSSGLEQLGRRAMTGECQELRNTLVHAFPNILMTGRGRPNPF